jgi:hypothetical protein
VTPQPPLGGGYKTKKLEMKEFEKSMYYGAKLETMDTAKILRKKMTFSE